MMKKKDVERIVDKNIEGLKKRLGLDRWRIVVEYGPAMVDGDDNHYPGMCNTDPDMFETALITLDPKQLETAAEVLNVLEHETAHCIGSYFNVCQAVLKRLLTKREYRALDVLFHIAHEAVVRSIQQILKSPPAEETQIKSHNV